MAQSAVGTEGVKVKLEKEFTHRRQSNGRRLSPQPDHGPISGPSSWQQLFRATHHHFASTCMICSRNGFVGHLPILFIGLFLVFSCFGFRSIGADGLTNQVSRDTTSKALAEVLSTDKWKLLEGSVDRALAWIATQQAANGSFPTQPAGQPAITSFCVLAFLSRGHQPGIGPYGQQLNRAIDFVSSCQKPDGLFSYVTPGIYHQDKAPSHTAAYNHAIAGLMLGEVYGHVTGQRAKSVKQAIEKALKFTRELQVRPKNSLDKGGW